MLVISLFLPIHQSGYNIITFLDSFGGVVLVCLGFLIILYFFLLIIDREFSPKLSQGIVAFILLLIIVPYWAIYNSGGMSSLPISNAEFFNASLLIFLKLISIALIFIIFTNTKINKIKEMLSVLSILLGLHAVILYFEGFYQNTGGIPFIGFIDPMSLVLFELTLILVMVPIWYSFLQKWKFNKALMGINLLSLSGLIVTISPILFSIATTILGLNSAMLTIPLIIIGIVFLTTYIGPASYDIIIEKRRQNRKKESEERQRILDAPETYEDLIKKAKYLSNSAESARNRHDFETSIKYWKETNDVLEQAKEELGYFDPAAISEIDTKIKGAKLSQYYTEVEEIYSKGETRYKEALDQSKKEEYTKATNIMNTSLEFYTNAMKLAEAYELNDLVENYRRKCAAAQNAISSYQVKLAELLNTLEFRRPEIIRAPTDPSSVQSEQRTSEDLVFIGRARVWEVNILNFKIKIQNNTKYVITNVRVILEDFPPMLNLLDESKMRSTSKLQPNGAIWTPEFKLSAGNECVSGMIEASVSYFDSEGKRRSLNVPPLEISYICPLLEAKQIEEIEYLRKTRVMTPVETRIEIEGIEDLSKAMIEMQQKMEAMNLAILTVQGDNGELVGYAEDKIKKDGLALEAKFEILEGKTDLILRVLCEHDRKCSPLLNKAVKELSTVNVSLDEAKIIQKLNMFVEKPDDLTKYFKRVIESDWPDAKKDKWARTIQEILTDWAKFKPSKWKKLGKALLKLAKESIMGILGGILSEGIKHLFNWIISELQEN